MVDPFFMSSSLCPLKNAWENWELTQIYKKLKVFKGKSEVIKHDIAPGEFETDEKKYLRFATADGWIYLEDLQLQGKKRMDIGSFLNGYRFEE